MILHYHKIISSDTVPLHST